MLFNQFPKKPIGLYDPNFEHDACGVSFVVNMKGKKSHEIIENALTILKHMAHRGASGAEKNTGDGAGILMQIPHKFFSKKITLPEPGNYAVGMIFLPKNPDLRNDCKRELEQIVKSEGQTVLGWLTVPTEDSSLGATAIACKPYVEQIFIGKNPEINEELEVGHKIVSGKAREHERAEFSPLNEHVSASSNAASHYFVTDSLEFERKLYVIRKKAEHSLRYAQSLDDQENFFYIVTLSSKTICYKGMLTPEQVSLFYPELLDPDMESAMALVHSRFSTNTFPSWERSHPYRFITHNGEINTLRGNINWMKARESVIKTDNFGIDLKELYPILHDDGSDSAIFDNCFEFLTLSGIPMAKVAMMMIPEPWSKHKTMEPNRKAFYEFHSTLMEPWDGPASIAFTDGVKVGAVLDRNGLRPSRYLVTSDDIVIMASEVGVLEIPSHKIIKKGRLEPGRMFLVDTEKGEIIPDEVIKSELAKEHPYQKWINEFQVSLKDLAEPEKQKNQRISTEDLFKYEKAFGYTYEEHQLLLGEMVTKKVDPVGSMGNDTPLAVLSDKPQLLYNYFRQLFAQVTNPPIDGIREELVTCTVSYLGSQGNLLAPQPESTRLIKLASPLLTISEFNKLVNLDLPGLKSLYLPILFEHKKDGDGIKEALDELFAKADKAILEGKSLLLLSDKNFTAQLAPIPALLAVAGLHHHLVKNGTRNRVSLVLETGEARSVHHFSVLLGYGADAICPYLALEVIEAMAKNNELENTEPEKAKEIYLKSALKGVLKVISKMGISTIQSYRGAQIFEAVGISRKVIDQYFTGTASRIEGIDLEIIAEETKRRFIKALEVNQDLDSGGDYKWRFEGEYHTINPEVIYKIQLATRLNDPKLYQEYVDLINNTNDHLFSLRDLVDFNFDGNSIPLEEVESVDEIVKRFKTGAMSYGSLGKEVHETIAIAMNRLGGKSNSGEGGEDLERFIPMPNGDSKSSAIKQVASGRFGVTSLYLSNAKEVQIKMAQGAKPGEGGQLPGRKVYPWIAKVRHSTPGVGLISPPPHHDIYSIEDLAQLIFDLKNANRAARINVKLVSEVGVGTIAAGVAKGHADVILISGAEGGTGASPRTSVKHAGLPWELGLAETHQTLLLNNLRSRVVLETDGQLKTGRDIAIAALLGAEEYGFGTMALVTLGCVMMRVCHLDTCPVGITTQNPELREYFKGKPEHLINFMRFIAADLRQIMAQLGFRTVQEMIGRTDKLKQNDKINHWKAKSVDISNLIFKPEVPADYGCSCQIAQEHGLNETLDINVLLELCAPALKNKEKVNETLKIKNINRAVSTILGNEITKKFGAAALPHDTITLNFKGSAGQSFGAFTPAGITLNLEGEANDYFGKGLSGAKLIVYPPADSPFKAEENILIGNVAFYGATSGEAYINGVAGERFCVRNSGVKTVVEGVGDHGLEYMTGGKVIILGKVGRNFAAGMSGGVAYVLDETGDFETNCNKEMVELCKITDEKEIEFLKTKITNHAEYTKSVKAKKILADFNNYLPKFIKVLPLDYKRVISAIEAMKAQGLSGDEAIMAAFEANKNDAKRVDGN